MKIITLDFETFFDRKAGYTIKKMTTEAYVRDPRFDIVGLGVIEKGESRYYEKPDVDQYLHSIDWNDTGVIAHHCQFDGLVLSHRFGIVPAHWIDTLSMARLVLGTNYDLSLEGLARHYRLEPKTMPYNAFDGLHFEDFDLDLRIRMALGCRHDCELTRAIAGKLLLDDDLPNEELKTIDLTIRMFTEPMLMGDAKQFEKIRDDEWAAKNELYMELGVSDKQLGSNDSFAKLLEAEGVEVEYKQGKKNKLPCFAKSDQFMVDLLESRDERIRDLAEARLLRKSTIDETRAGRLRDMAARGPMPIYLKYCAAQTLRWGGGDKSNWQNFSRPKKDMPESRKGALRKAIKAPPNHLLSVIDESQIECRLLNTFFEQEDVVERFRRGEDPYLPNACKYYGREITVEDTAERGFGKQLELSCGFGAGGHSIVTTARRGAYGPPIFLTEEEGVAARDVYRHSHPRVVQGWKEGDQILNALYNGERYTWRDILEIRNHRIYMPNGAAMIYWLRWNEDERTFERKTRQGWRRIWGGVVVQNICEAMGRLIISQSMVRLFHNYGIRCVGTVHDENWFLHTENEAEWRHAKCMEEMTRVPTWLPKLPLAAEGHLGEGYDK